VWLYPGMVGWHFAMVEKNIAKKINKMQEGKKRRGWGSVPVSVTIGKTKWKTSIFPDKQSGGYLLPLKAQVRRKEGIYDGGIIKVKLEF